ncbi:DUF3575 domain-containing protein [Hyunsoonleella flava]|uniref:DUF3575 domain-containing protein n=1 Tax=Hyunsoonleella flava TaxID=2527939 RepID=A0A4Q9FB43_9FLAO|nr:DUF3575 domain-containing protein [Hyunsoonleella flava]TBM98993.1 DUF3575 domain-containing protein [Hyunsoonleella flava]
MKKLFVVTILALLISNISFAQEDNNSIDLNDTSTNFNEIKLNGLFLVLGAFEVTYERTLNEESGAGVSLFLPIDDDVSDEIKYYVSPYYRFYFGKKYAAGFYVEGFGMLNSTVSYDIEFTSDSFIEKNEAKTDFALGIGIGGKWVTKSGFVGELGFGVGRNFFNNNDLDYEIIGKGGITLGYRF